MAEELVIFDVVGQVGVLQARVTDNPASEDNNSVVAALSKRLFPANERLLRNKAKRAIKKGLKRWRFFIK